PPHTTAADESADEEGPATELEHAVAAIWHEVLGVERVGALDNFFELGGHSLMATRVLTRVQAQLGVDLPVRAIFEGPTVRELAERIDRALPAGTDADAGTSGASASSRALVAVDRSGPLPLSFA